MQFQKTAQATGDLIGNKIDDKITSVSTKLHSKKPNTNTTTTTNNNEDVELTTRK